MVNLAENIHQYLCRYQQEITVLNLIAWNSLPPVNLVMKNINSKMWGGLLYMYDSKALKSLDYKVMQLTKYNLIEGEQCEK